jgi:hypothetical protein
LKNRPECDAIISDFVGRDAAADAELEPAAAELVEHADLFEEAQRVMQRQRVDQRPEAQAPRALRHCGEKDAGSRRHAERRRMMLGQVIAADAEPVIGLDQRQPVLVKLAERLGPAVEMVEDADLHHAVPSGVPCGKS